MKKPPARTYPHKGLLRSDGLIIARSGEKTMREHGTRKHSKGALRRTGASTQRLRFKNPRFSIHSSAGKLQFPRPLSYFVARTSSAMQKGALRRTGASSKVKVIIVSAAALRAAPFVASAEKGKPFTHLVSAMQEVPEQIVASAQAMASYAI